ncbi:MAG: c-type cytochrome [Planctomycetota bacterium]
MPKWIHNIFLTLTILAFIPPVIILRARTATSSEPRIHFIQDMDNQQKFKAQAQNKLFADGRAMRPPVEHTIARNEFSTDLHFLTGILGKNPDGTNVYAKGFPASVTIDDALLERGEEKYKHFCSPCHGLDGAGDGPVALQGAVSTAKGTVWTQPTNLHGRLGADSPAHEAYGDGRLFNTITNGVRNMSSYARQIPVADRWAIVAHVRALQLSQAAPAELVPDDVKAELEKNPNRFIPKKKN